MMMCDSSPLQEVFFLDGSHTLWRLNLLFCIRILILVFLTVLVASSIVYPCISLEVTDLRTEMNVHEYITISHGVE